MRGYLSPSTVVRAGPRLRPVDDAVRPEAQVVSLVEHPGPGESRPGRIDLRIPLTSALLDDLFAARLAPVDVNELAERLGLTGARCEGFRRLFTDQPPPSYELNLTADVRMRFFGHASALLDFGGFTLLTDPSLDAEGFDSRYSVADLPATIDVVVLSHGTSGHFSLETLLQLRHRIGVVVVPRPPAGSPSDGGARAVLEHYGFTEVVELSDMETVETGPARITALRFPDERREAGTGAPMVPFVRLGGRGFLFTTDTSPASGQVPGELGRVDAVLAFDIEPWLVRLTDGRGSDPSELLHITDERTWSVCDEPE